MPEFDVFTGSVEGVNTAFVVPSLPDNASELVREGVARRRISMINAVCPCGGRRAPLNRAMRRRLKRGGAQEFAIADIAHEPDCPAVAPETVAHILGWRWAT
jgi:hypothetical protein